MDAKTCKHMVRQLWIFLPVAFQSFHSSSLSDESCWSFSGSSSSPAMLEHVCNLLASVHFRPLTMHVQSFGRQARAHLHDSKLRTTLGAGDPVIQLITMLQSSLVVHPCPWLGLGVSGEFTKLRRHMAAWQFARRVCCLSVSSHGGCADSLLSPLLLRNIWYLSSLTLRILVLRQ